MELSKAYQAGIEYGMCLSRKDFNDFKTEKEKQAWWLGFEESLPGSNNTLFDLLPSTLTKSKNY